VAEIQVAHHQIQIKKKENQEEKEDLFGFILMILVLKKKVMLVVNANIVVRLKTEESQLKCKHI
jgi:hypothetical protein